MSNNELYTITKQYHEKKDIDIWVVRLETKVNDDTFAELKGFAKQLHGYYSTFYGVNGFVFKDIDNAEKFGDKLDDYLRVEVSYDGHNYNIRLPEFDDYDIKESETLNGGSKSEDNQEDEETEEIPLDNFCAALRLLTGDKGANVLSDNASISKNIDTLKSLDGFKSLPPSIEFILRTIIMKRYGQQLLAIKDWEDESSQLVTTFVYNTGFKDDLSEAVFECLAYAIGKVSQVNTVLVDTLVNQEEHPLQDTNDNGNEYSTKDFYHKSYIKREKLWCVIFEADWFAGNPDFAAFRRKAEKLSHSIFDCQKIANGIGFYSMKDRNDFVDMINDKRFVNKQ